MKDAFYFWWWFIIAVLVWFSVVYFANAATNPNVIRPNPDYIPVIMACSNYDSRCGQEFKKVLALYDYRVCKRIGEADVTVWSDEGDYQETIPWGCQEWYHPSELHFIFNALPGWRD